MPANADLKHGSSGNALVGQDYQKRQEDLLVWAEDVKRFQAGSMQELQGFVDCMEGNLKTLVDQQAVLELMGEDWPARRYDDFLLAVKEYQKLSDLKRDVDTWQLPPVTFHTQTALDLLQRKFDAVQWQLHQHHRERDALQQQFAAVQLPSLGDQLLADVRMASLKLPRAYVDTVLKEVDRLAAKRPRPRNLQQRQMLLLKQGGEMLFSAHQLVGAFDSATQQCVQVLKAVKRKVQDGMYRPGTAAAAQRIEAEAAAIAAGCSSKPDFRPAPPAPPLPPWAKHPRLPAATTATAATATAAKVTPGSPAPKPAPPAPPLPPWTKQPCLYQQQRQQHHHHHHQHQQQQQQQQQQQRQQPWLPQGLQCPSLQNLPHH